MEVLARAVRQKKEIKGIHTGQEAAKLCLFADNMKILKTAPKKLLESINEFSKVSGHKKQHTKNSLFLYRNNNYTKRNNENNLIHDNTK